MTKKLKTLRTKLQTIDSARLGVVSPDSWRSGKSSSERGYNYRWQKAREGFLKKHPACVYCERKGIIEEATVVDHIRPHRGDKKLFWDRNNWQSLCGRCHSSVKQREEHRG